MAKKAKRVRVAENISTDYLKKRHATQGAAYNKSKSMKDYKKMVNTGDWLTRLSFSGKGK